MLSLTAVIVKTTQDALGFEILRNEFPRRHSVLGFRGLGIRHGIGHAAHRGVVDWSVVRWQVLLVLGEPPLGLILELREFAALLLQERVFRSHFVVQLSDRLRLGTTAGLVVVHLGLRGRRQGVFLALQSGDEGALLALLLFQLGT